MKLTKYTAGLLIASFTFASVSAMPAKANEEDLAKFLGGLLTIYILSQAIDQGQAAPQPPVAHKPQPVQKPVQQPAPRKRMAAHIIPSQCVTTARVGGKPELVAFNRCLKRERGSQAPLPQDCKTRIRTRNGEAKAYRMTCLTDYGYRARGARRGN